ncbi:nuclear transport factor 2 family protein [Chitinophaga horti]|uniref:Nuclear transport factor 2 family protein n=1 Tax=Chitinophaga horti TaxID=2920382 RepID=A0ABY6J3L5_9BACT|nr:nuclear transport factor 2 family protein [Chitinophaga horti]UYQ94264.1 nuclear transport factor 2 family protein [Chitinophaga horti]
MKFTLPILFVKAMLAVNSLVAQTPAQEEVKTVIQQMFEGMRKGDSAVVRGVFADKALLQTIVDRNDAPVKVSTADLGGFLKAIGTPHTDVWDERITFSQILLDGKLASVWTPYKFYLGDKLQHCGVNSFQLVKLATGWKIVHLIDTRRKNCE